MGYAAPTNDPIAALQRKQAAAARAEREALSASGTQSFQAVRKLQAQIETLQNQQETLQNQQETLQNQQETLQNQQETLADQQTQLTAVVAAIPVTSVAQGSASAFSVSSSWATVATVTVSRPTGKTTAAVLALASLAMDCQFSSSSGGAWPNYVGRIVIGGETGAEFTFGGFAQSAGGSGTIHLQTSEVLIQPRSWSGTGNISVSVQVRMDGVVSGDASNITGWSNTARVTALVAFSE